MSENKLKVAVHKLTSCSGCQLAFLNQGPALLGLLELVEFTHFIEGGLYNPDAEVDLALVEGSVSTLDDLERLQKIRQHSKYLVSVGACATSGGIQALRNFADKDEWKMSVYAHPEFVEELKDSKAVAEHTKVDFELWGCPVTQGQVTHLVQQLSIGVFPKDNPEKLCMDCKRHNHVCVLVTGQAPCLGPVVRTGCGALCPKFGKACYGCFGPSEQPNCESLSNRLAGFGMVPEEISQRFAAIHCDSKPFKEQIHHWNAISVREVE